MFSLFLICLPAEAFSGSSSSKPEPASPAFTLPKGSLGAAFSFQLGTPPSLPAQQVLISSGFDANETVAAKRCGHRGRVSATSSAAAVELAELLAQHFNGESIDNSTADYVSFTTSGNFVSWEFRPGYCGEGSSSPPSHFLAAYGAEVTEQMAEKTSADVLKTVSDFDPKASLQLRFSKDLLSQTSLVASMLNNAEAKIVVSAGSNQLLTWFADAHSESDTKSASQFKSYIPMLSMVFKHAEMIFRFSALDEVLDRVSEMQSEGWDELTPANIAFALSFLEDNGTDFFSNATLVLTSIFSGDPVYSQVVLQNEPILGDATDKIFKLYKFLLAAGPLVKEFVSAELGTGNPFSGLFCSISGSNLNIRDVVNTMLRRVAKRNWQTAVYSANLEAIQGHLDAKDISESDIMTGLDVAATKGATPIIENILNHLNSPATASKVLFKAKDINTVQVCLAHGASPNATRVAHGVEETILEWAAANMSYQSVRALTDAGARLEAGNSTALEAACTLRDPFSDREESIKIIEHLLSTAQIQYSKKQLGKAMLGVISHGLSELVPEFLAKGATANGDVNENVVGDSNQGSLLEGLTPLSIAVKRANIDIVSMLLEAKADPNLRGKMGSPLEIVLEPEITAAKALIAGVGVNNRGPLVISSSRLAVLRLLLEANADPNILAKDGHSLLQSVLISLEGKTQVEAVSLLLKAKADPNFKGIDKLTSLTIAVKSIAAKRANIDIVPMLLEAKADPNLRGALGSPLEIALEPEMTVARDLFAGVNNRGPLVISSSRLAVLRLLLEANADPNILAKDGHSLLRSVLVSLASNTQVEVVSLLLKAKADPNFKGIDKQLPLESILDHRLTQEVQRNKQLEIVSLLLEAKADPNDPSMLLRPIDIVLQKAGFSTEEDTTGTGLMDSMIGAVTNYMDSEQDQYMPLKVASALIKQLVGAGAMPEKAYSIVSAVKSVTKSQEKAMMAVQMLSSFRNLGCVETDSNGWKPLVWAAFLGDENLVSILSKCPVKGDLGLSKALETATCSLYSCPTIYATRKQNEVIPMLLRKLITRRLERDEL